MVQVEFNQQVFSADNGLSLLNALAQQGVNLPQGCRSGVCQACLVQITQGVIPPAAQAGLSPQQKSQGLAMACVCLISAPLTAQTPQIHAARHDSRLLQRRWLKGDILQLHLSKPFDYQAGQFVRLFPQEPTNEPHSNEPQAEVGRCYSLASLPAEEHLELHIRVLPEGRVSRLLADLAVGSKVQLQGPMGRCFYQAQSLQQPLLLAAIGTGMAPILGVARAAVNAGHQGPIYCVLGAKEESGLYPLPGLHQVAAAGNIQLTYIVQQPGNHSDTYEIGDIYSKIRTLLPDMRGVQAYICGAPSFVQRLKKQCFLAGASLNEIFSDAFLPN